MQPPIIILMNTQLGENIGMCARAMLNCGLDQLRLINPRDGWPNKSATATAADADQVIDSTQCFNTLEEAISDCHQLYAATARPRSRQIPALPVFDAIGRILALSETDNEQQSAILFGPEASGLDNESLSRADALIHFPMNPKFNSLNLAQAVLLFGWEWMRLQSKTSNTQSDNRPLPDNPASKNDLIAFLDRLEVELDTGGFFLTPELRPDAIRNLRAIFNRATPSEQELRMLHGVITALKTHRP